MLDKTLASSFDLVEDIVPINRLKDFEDLESMTSLQERESLYATARYIYTGEGDIWDLGSSAGGSSFCLAAGIKDRTMNNSNKTVKCFDLFRDCPKHFEKLKQRLGNNANCLDAFYLQTDSVCDFVTPVKMNLILDLDSYKMQEPIELAHIDSAKSLELWVSIFKKISNAIIPNKTIWIFQDFARARLPWQIYSLAEMMKIGDFVGGSNFGVLYFKFNDKIESKLRNKIINDDFSIEEKTKNIQIVFDLIKEKYRSLFKSNRIGVIDDIENTVLAYCYYWQNDKRSAQKILNKTSKQYLAFPSNLIYSKEIFS